MSELDILFPLPDGRRNADDMGMPPSSADCIGTGCAKAALLARVRELEAELAREKREHDCATTFHAVAVKERDLERHRVRELEAELRGRTQNFDDACTTLAKVEAERDALRA